jgi:tetratricopeptide (TPR) repeat protein
MILHDLATIAKPSLLKGSLEEKCFKLIQKGVSREEIKHKIFGDDQSASLRLRQVEFQLKKKLVASVASHVSKTGNNNLDEYTEAYQLLSAGKILLARQKQQSGISLLEKAYKIASQEAYLSVALDSAKSLWTYYSTISIHPKKFDAYKEAVYKYKEALSVETMAQAYYNEIAYSYAQEWTPDVAVKALSYCAILADKIETSKKTAWYYYSILMIADIANLDFHASITHAEEGISYFSKFDHIPKASIYTLLQKKATAYIHLGEFEAATNCLDEVLGLTAKGSYTYCSAQFYRAIAGIHSADYALAVEAIQSTEAYLENLPPNFQEQWKIAIAYTSLLSERKFKLGKFLNEVPIFSKDKAGANAAILIVQMLHYLKQAKTSAYIERCDALHIYTQRHLSGKNKTLAKLLIEVAKGHFHINTVTYRTRKLVKELDSQERELAIMPQELVWKLVLGWLG